MTIEEFMTKQEITELRLAYAAYFDKGDYEALSQLFTKDAVCEFGPEYGGDWVGRDTIRQKYIEAIKEVGGGFNSLHVVTNPWITLTGPDTAHGRWYLLDILSRQRPHIDMETLGGHAMPLLYLGIYEDDYRIEDGVWKIDRVRLHFLWPNRSFTSLAHPEA